MTTVARMWESRIADGRMDEFVAFVGELWPRFTELPGFAGGEFYRSDNGEHRAVVVTRWRDQLGAAAGAGLETQFVPFCVRAPMTWVFRQIELAEGGPNGPGGDAR